MTDIHQWINRIIAQPLPIFRQTRDNFNAIGADSKLTLRHFIPIILKDPPLMIHLIKQANELYEMRPHARISSIAQAAILIGLPQLIHSINHLPVIEDLGNRAAENGYRVTARRAFHAGFYAQDWTTLTNDSFPETALVAAQLRIAAELALWVVGNEQELIKIENLAQTEKLNIKEAQQSILGVQPEILGDELAKLWCFPQMVNDSFDSNVALNSPAQRVRLACELTEALEFGKNPAMINILIEEIAEQLQINIKETKGRIRKTAQIAATNSIFFPKKRTPKPKPVVPDDQLAPLSKRKQVATPAQSTSTLVVNENPPKEDLLGDYKIWQQTLTILTKTEERAALPIHQLMSVVLRGLSAGLGLDRIFFALLDKNKATLVIRYVRDAQAEKWLLKQQIQLTPQNLIAQLMAKPQSLFFKLDKPQEIAKLFPGELTKIVDTQSFFAHSIFVQQRPLGLIYADNRYNNHQLNDETYRQFNILCQHMHTNIAKLTSG